MVDGKNRKKLEQLAQSEGMEGKITFLGFLPNPAPWFANGKIFLLCSRFEVMPTVLIEVLMLDRMIIAFDCPTGPSEILNNVECGCLVPPEDQAAVSDAIINILRDKSLQRTSSSTKNYSRRILYFPTERNAVTHRIHKGRDIHDECCSL